MKITFENVSWNHNEQKTWKAEIKELKTVLDDFDIKVTQELEIKIEDCMVEDFKKALGNLNVLRRIEISKRLE